MIIVDSALKEREHQGKPIRVGMVGAGFMGRGVALQILSAVPGMDLVAVSNRDLDGAARAYREAGVVDIQPVETAVQLEKAIAHRRCAITDDAMILCEAEGIDAIIEVTGAIEFGAQVAMKAIEYGKHFITMNAELDGTLGPILKVHADKAGIVFTGADGDQPGVTMNLYRFVRSIGVKPVLCGNIKVLHDPYRNPTTQEGFAKKWRQNPYMVTSFADGTKISFEQAIVANATGMKIGKRGMFGPTVPIGTPIKAVMEFYPEEALLEGPGIVDYVVGADPTPGIFVLGTHDHELQQHYLHLYKLGKGPLYCFYRPYHLCHFEVPSSIARAVLFNDATIAPLSGPCVDVVTTAKIDLKKGDTLDRLGGYKSYGLCENATTASDKKLLPIGLAEGCRLNRDVAKDAVLTYEDVDLPSGRLSDKLRFEQNAFFNLEHAIHKDDSMA